MNPRERRALMACLARHVKHDVGTCEADSVLLAHLVQELLEELDAVERTHELCEVEAS